MGTVKGLCQDVKSMEEKLQTLRVSYNKLLNL